MSITEKIKSGKCLTEEEVKDIVTQATCIDGLALVDEVEGDMNRWSQDILTVLSYKGHYYALNWQRGLTEMQENYYDPQIAKEVKEVKKTIVVTEWRDIKSDN